MQPSFSTGSGQVSGSMMGTGGALQTGCRPLRWNGAIENKGQCARTTGVILKAKVYVETSVWGIHLTGVD